LEERLRDGLNNGARRAMVQVQPLKDRIDKLRRQREHAVRIVTEIEPKVAGQRKELGTLEDRWRLCQDEITGPCPGCGR
jgi:hypothetical protein